LVAIGGDLSVPRLLAAYRSGIFPWYNDGLPILWWSPNPRAVLPMENLHVSRSMRRVLRHGEFQVTWNQAFTEVMRLCGEERSGGTWILPEMRLAYESLHRAGYAHSIEVWLEGKLAGGLYGVRLGGLFAAESMFHRVTDASKVALIVACRNLHEDGVSVFDVQFVTDHLRRMGAIELTRDDYLGRVAQAVATQG
jgi:leucyl/phenylalanyl-tRNA--protein transferase